MDGESIVIFYWLRLAWLKVVWLLTPPTAKDIARVDVNAPCPACGARSGKIACVTDTQSIFVQHECQVCMVKWHEQPVTKVSTTTVLAAGFITAPSRSGRAA